MSRKYGATPYLSSSDEASNVDVNMGSFCMNKMKKGRGILSSSSENDDLSDSFSKYYKNKKRYENRNHNHDIDIDNDNDNDENEDDDEEEENWDGDSVMSNYSVNRPLIRKRMNILVENS